jgi:hypothetical protein
MSIFRLVLVPGIITAAVTLLRLTGELNHWSRTFFSREAGGGLAIVGIAWLVPIFGIYFAKKLSDSGRAGSGWRTFGFALAGIVAFFAVNVVLAMLLGIDPNQPTLAALGVGLLASIIALALTLYGTGALGKTLLVYGLFARFPVVLVMLLAILGNWGTHYDVLPPGVTTEMGPWVKWVLIGVAPQLGFWMAFTVVLGAFFGGLALVVAERRRQAAVRPA